MITLYVATDDTETLRSQAITHMGRLNFFSSECWIFPELYANRDYPMPIKERIKFAKELIERNLEDPANIVTGDETIVLTFLKYCKEPPIVYHWHGGKMNKKTTVMVDEDLYDFNEAWDGGFFTDRFDLLF